jgi:putative transposase
MVLHCAAMRQLFLNVVKRAKKKYRFRIDNFVIMGNHVHLIIRPGDGESLSAIMQWLLGVFAQAWNRAHFQTGHVWGDRFFSKIINDCQEYIKTFLYVVYNPSAAHMVRNPEDWEFGGLWHFISGQKDILADLPLWIRKIYHAYIRFFCPAVQASAFYNAEIS